MRGIGRVYAALARRVVPDLSSCFDAAYYLERYPDVGTSGMDLLGHYLLFGAREGRQPSALFDVKYYAASYPDVAASGSNPLLHFLRYGWREGRRPNPLFDAVYYAGQFPERFAPGAGGNPFADFARRRGAGEKVRGWLPFKLPAQNYQVATTKNNDRQPIDIIIPVYSGLAETRRCLESLLRATCLTSYQVVLVNDCSPDPQLTQYLREMSLTQGFVLLDNPGNLGFAASVNRGMEAHRERDVVLLNNDTQVANDWLDRLSAAAYSDPRIGTVTPFSNHATICSYPKEGSRAMIDGADPLDGVFREVNAGHRIDIPTAVGFCMYIRRDCLNEAGWFRADVFGRGYGEENDFSLRAIYKGWRNVLAADVFVYHAGETSFGVAAAQRREAGVEAVNRLHPGYTRILAEYTCQDPAKPYRIAVSAWRMRHSGRPVILAISHDLGGGVGQYVGELREAVAGQAEMLALTPGSGDVVMLRNLDPDDDFRVAFSTAADDESDYAALLELLRRCGVSRIHVQHLAGHKLDVLRLKRDLGVPLDFSLHDYFVICPQVTLVRDPDAGYCGEPVESECNACLTERPPTPDLGPRLDIRGWRKKYGEIVMEAERVIAPSRDAGERLRRYFPEANIITAAHPGPGDIPPVTPARLGRGEPLVIAALGAMTQHKGLRRFRAIAKEAGRQKLPLRFVLAGYVEKGLGQRHEPFLSTGPYIKDQLPGLLREAGAQVVWFPAQWPETFSYTLSVCLDLGLPVVAPDIGAFAERLAGRSWTWIVPWNLDDGRMLELFVALRRDHFLSGIPPSVPGGTGMAPGGDFYPAAYLGRHSGRGSGPLND